MACYHIFRLGCVSLTLALVGWQPCAADTAEATSGTILGGGNVLLAEGSMALQEGRIAEGIRLTLEGLKDMPDPREAASGHSNLCGGYALLRNWAQALEQCNAAIELDHDNWQSFNNRAAVHAGLVQYDLALADLHSGLELDPQSSTLHKSLAVVEHNQRVMNKRAPSMLRS
jgi:tetratricopeptide (TPR) repeat protein